MLPARLPAPKPASKPAPARKRRRRWLLLLLLLLFGFGGYRAVRGDPNLKRVRELQKELFTAEARDLPAEERTEKFRQLRAATEQLAPESRQELSAERRRRFEAELKRYHDLPPEEKAHYLDQRIAAEEQRRQNRPPGQEGAGPRPPGPGGGAASSAEERERRRKERLDETTPEFRALLHQFFKDMQTRRQQLGLPTRGR